MQTIRRFSKLQVHVMINEAVSEATKRNLASVYDGVIQVKDIACPHVTNASWTKSNYTKLNIWFLILA